MLFPIALLSAAGFTVVTTEFIIVGILPAVARDLDVSISEAGLLVSLFGLAVALAGPVLTPFVSHLPRRRFFVAALVVVGIANALAACAPDIGVMALARLVPALLIPVYWSLASGTVVTITGPDNAGKGVAIVNYGIIAATVFGIPIGTLIGDAFGWRAAFLSLAVLCFLKAAVLYRFFPAMPAAAATTMSGRFRLLKDPVLAAHVLLSLLVFCGMFTSYTYLADLLEQLAGLSSEQTGWCLMAFGAVGILGNFAGGRLVDRDPLLVTLVFIALLAGGMLAVAPLARAPAELAAALACWGAAQAGLFLVSHVRVIKAVPQAAEFGASLNISGANLGIALGALVGGQVIDGPGLPAVGAAGAAILAAAALLTLHIRRSERRRGSALAMYGS